MLTTLEVLLRFLGAIVAGGLIGMERERSRQSAGFRTHILITVGITLVMIISTTKYAPGAVGNDPMRLASQAISGIGFLGAGAIIKEGANIRGLTTAAGLWASAAIGLAFGAGMYREGTIATVIVLLTLTVLSYWDYRMPKAKTEKTDKEAPNSSQSKNVPVKVSVTRELSKGSLDDINEILRTCGFKVVRMSVDRMASEEEKAVLSFHVAPSAGEEFSADKCLSAIHRLPGVEHIEFETLE